jgi:hypothetical protein
MREEKEEAKEKQEETESPTSMVRLTGRDKELMAHVATARYLTGAVKTGAVKTSLTARIRVRC